MSFPDAMAAQPAWVVMWMNVLMLGGFVLPIALLIWRETRLAGVFSILGNAVNVVAVGALYNTMGYVKLLGLPHIVVWTPLVVYLVVLARRPGTRVWPRYIALVVAAVLSVSLAFDIVDVARWLLGERTPTILPA
ncbi:hypothetical protein [uncultured Tateyamaria sp.]|uniref:hypothetical protein n=1 Tax=uncultured Tateyamaria sp. TaxID=455651 RepID=UPI0026070908|nr:hypothetical protein [uncultured Tateyamaria sp.]